jgi:hypothetical protein
MDKYAKKILNSKPDESELISNFDLYEYFGKDLQIVVNTNIFDYSLDQLVNNKFKSTVILIEGDFSNHWVLFSKVDGVFEYFDSYGHSYKNDPYLKKYFAGVKILENKIRFQEMAVGINTCGKFVAMRLLCLLCYGMNLRQFQRFMKSLVKEFGGDYDAQVAMFVKIA